MLLNVYSTFDSLIHAGIPYLTVLGLTCSVLITSTTYGYGNVTTLLFATTTGVCARQFNILLLPS